MAAASSYLADRAEHYRQLAAVIRSRAAAVKHKDARDALLAVATDYEHLARHAESQDRIAETPAKLAPSYAAHRLR